MKVGYIVVVVDVDTASGGMKGVWVSYFILDSVEIFSIHPLDTKVTHFGNEFLWQSLTRIRHQVLYVTVIIGFMRSCERNMEKSVIFKDII